MMRFGTFSPPHFFEVRTALSVPGDSLVQAMQTKRGEDLKTPCWKRTGPKPVGFQPMNFRNQGTGNIRRPGCWTLVDFYSSTGGFEGCFYQLKSWRNGRTICFCKHVCITGWIHRHCFGSTIYVLKKVSYKVNIYIYVYIYAHVYVYRAIFL